MGMLGHKALLDVRCLDTVPVNLFGVSFVYSSACIIGDTKELFGFGRMTELCCMHSIAQQYLQILIIVFCFLSALRVYSLSCLDLGGLCAFLTKCFMARVLKC